MANLSLSPQNEVESFYVTVDSHSCPCLGIFHCWFLLSFKAHFNCYLFLKAFIGNLKLGLTTLTHTLLSLWVNSDNTIDFSETFKCLSHWPRYFHLCVPQTFSRYWYIIRASKYLPNSTEVIWDHFWNYMCKWIIGGISRIS